MGGKINMCGGCKNRKAESTVKWSHVGKFLRPFHVLLLPKKKRNKSTLNPYIPCNILCTFPVI